LHGFPTKSADSHSSSFTHFFAKSLSFLAQCYQLAPELHNFPRRRPAVGGTKQSNVALLGHGIRILAQSKLVCLMELFPLYRVTSLAPIRSIRPPRLAGHLQFHEDCPQSELMEVSHSSRLVRPQVSRKPIFSAHFLKQNSDASISSHFSNEK